MAKHKKAYWGIKGKLKDILLYSFFILFVFAVFYHASLDPREEERIVHDIKIFFQRPFNNIFSEQSPPPTIPHVATNDTAKISYQKSFVIYNIVQENNRTILYGTSE